MNKQKLSVKLNNTPISTSLAYSSVNSELNKGEILSVQNKVLADNNLEENLQSRKTGQNLRVSVINMRNEPLMPTTPRKARILVKRGEASVQNRTPFVIKLKYVTGESKQPLTLGIDSGYKYVGLSIISSTEEVFSGTLTLLERISSRISSKRMYRRLRRSRLWYRESRYNNRKNMKGKFAPSIQHKYETYLKIVKLLKSYFPIVNINIEISSFDINKLKNLKIKNIKYKQGYLEKGYLIRNYLLEKFNRRCVYCNKPSKTLEVEHIIPKSRGGTNSLDNLAIACTKCNRLKGSKTAEEFGFKSIQEQASTFYKSEAFFNNVKKLLMRELKAKETFGYITKYMRIKYNIQKSHINDAFIIAGGLNQKRCMSYNIKQTRRNNRKLQMSRRGLGILVRKKRYKFQKDNLVLYNNKEVYTILGTRNYGRQIIIEDKTINSKKTKIICYNNSFLFSPSYNNGVEV